MTFTRPICGFLQPLQSSADSTLKYATTTSPVMQFASMTAGYRSRDSIQALPEYMPEAVPVYQHARLTVIDQRSTTNC